jgi:hypothetical protein
MNELGLNPATLAGWFTTTALATHDYVQVPAAQNAQWSAGLAVAVRRCYMNPSTASSKPMLGFWTRSK